MRSVFVGEPTDSETSENRPFDAPFAAGRDTAQITEPEPEPYPCPPRKRSGSYQRFSDV